MSPSSDPEPAARWQRVPGIPRQWTTVRSGWKWQRGPWAVRRIGSTRGKQRFEVWCGGKLFDEQPSKHTALEVADEAIRAEGNGALAPWTEESRAAQREADAEAAIAAHLNDLGPR